MRTQLAFAAGLLFATAARAQAPVAAPVVVPEAMSFDVPYGTPITMDHGP